MVFETLILRPLCSVGLDQMSDAAAHVLYTFAHEGQPVPIPAWSRWGSVLTVVLLLMFGYRRIRVRAGPAAR